ncbi:hypothetical protein [Kaarinaea lacus]
MVLSSNGFPKSGFSSILMVNAACGQKPEFNPMSMLFKHIKTTQRGPGRKRFLLNSMLISVGYILSPLSWWNDMVVNVPLAYMFSIPFSFIDECLFLPAFVLGYWLTNLAGFLLLHRGAVGLVSKQPRQTTLRHQIVISILYTVIIVLMVWLEWIPLPTELIK